MLICTSYYRPILTYACLVWSFASKSQVSFLIEAQNLSIRQILAISWHFQNFHIYKKEHSNLIFHLALEIKNNLILNTCRMPPEQSYTWETPLNWLTS